MEKVARLLHGKVIPKDKVELVEGFIERMRKGMNFFNEEDLESEKGTQIFEGLKEFLDSDGKYMKSMAQIEALESEIEEEEEEENEENDGEDDK